jgi:ubiquinone/menaquinone biosynthesis C-methylase UbiE
MREKYILSAFFIVCIRDGDVKNLERFQPKGETWQSRASKGNVLQAVLDPADYVGRKNEFIDVLHKIALSNYLSLSGKERILDFGTGPGRFAFWLSLKASFVVGIDVTKEMLHLAKKVTHRENVEFLLCDGTNTPFKDESFDVILSVWVFQHFPDKEFRNAARRLIRQLKRGGKMFLIEQVSKKTSDYYIHRLPEEYVKEFEGCKCVTQKPIRKSGAMVTRMVGTRIIPKVMFPMIAKLELFRRQVESIPEIGYLDYLFIFEK